MELGIEGFRFWFYFLGRGLYIEEGREGKNLRDDARFGLNKGGREGERRELRFGASAFSRVRERRCDSDALE